MKLDEAQRALIKELMSRRAVCCKHETIKHSYPHCWRHKTPVIFRATPQWFICMDQQRLRANTLRDIPKVQWIPGLGRAAHRRHDREPPGLVHLAPAHLGRADRAVRAQAARGALHPRTPELLEQVAARVEQDGIEAWFELDAARVARRRGRPTTRRSPTSWTCGPTRACQLRVRRQRTRPEIARAGRAVSRRLGPASRLVPQLAADVGGAVRARAVQERADARLHRRRQGPQDVQVARQRRSRREKVMSTLGADVLRLWVAATDYANEMSVSDEILKRMSDSYRRMRNTVRFLLGNLHGFDPATDAVEPAADGGARPLGAARAPRALQEEIVDGLPQVPVPPDLPEGAQLLRRRSRRLLSRHPQGPPVHDARRSRVARRSAQTALFHIAEAHGALARADPVVHGGGDLAALPQPASAPESVFLTTWHALPDVPATRLDWHALIDLRSAVLREIEKLRDAGTVGASLDAEVDVYCTDEVAPRYEALGDELRFLTITSDGAASRGRRVRLMRWRPCRRRGLRALAGVTLKSRASSAREVRALLAPAHRCGQRSGASRALRALRRQHRRCAGTAAVRMSAPVLPPVRRSGLPLGRRHRGRDRRSTS